MKRGKKLLLLLLVLAIAAGAAVAALRLFSDGETTAEAEADTVILSLSEEDLSAFQWTVDDVTLAFTRTDDGWEYAEDPAFPLIESGLTTVISAVEGLTASKTIPEPESLSPYGLDTPVCEVTAETATGVWVLRIGNENDLGGKRYVSTGDGNVYLTDASILNAFPTDLYDLARTETIPYMSNVTAFTLRSGEQDLSIVHLPDSGLAYSDSYAWFLPDGEGDFLPLDTELTEDLVESVTMMNWAGCVEYAADADALEGYGLTDPAAVVTVEYTSTVQEATNLTDDSGNVIYETREEPEEFVLELGNYVDSSYCYARLQDSSMVYLVNATILDGLLQADDDSLRPDEVLSVNWSLVTDMEITLSDEEYVLTKEPVPGEEPVQEESEDDLPEEDVAVTYETAWMEDGRAVAIEDALAELTSLTVQGYGDGVTPEVSEALRIRILQDYDPCPEIELVFYEYNSDSFLVTRNGDTILFVSRDSVLSLLGDLTDVLTPAAYGDTAGEAD